MKSSIIAFVVSVLLFSSGSSFAWWNNNGWGNNYNPYDEWDPRYWAEEMFGGNDYYGPYGGGPGYGYGPYGGGPGYGYGPYGGGPGYGYGPYGGGPGYGPYGGPYYGPR